MDYNYSLKSFDGIEFDEIKVGFWENQKVKEFDEIRALESNLTNLDASLIEYDCDKYVLFDSGDWSGTLLFVNLHKFQKCDIEYKREAVACIIESFDYLKGGAEGEKQISEILDLLNNN